MEHEGDSLYYILSRELYRIRKGEMIPMAWENGSWEKKPFAFEVEERGRMISEEEARDWIKAHARPKRSKMRL